MCSGVRATSEPSVGGAERLAFARQSCCDHTYKRVCERAWVCMRVCVKVSKGAFACVGVVKERERERERESMCIKENACVSERERDIYI